MAEDVELSEAYNWPDVGECFFRKLTPTELHLLMMELAGDRKRAWRLWPWIVAASCCDSHGVRHFTKADRARLEELPSSVITTAGRFAARFNGICS